MVVLDTSIALALVAALCFSVQVIVIERAIGIDSDGSKSDLIVQATLITIVVSTVIFWAIVYTRSTGLEFLTVRGLLPFVAVGIVYPTCFRLLYFKGIDRIGASVAAAIVGAHPAVAIVFAVPLLGESLTTLVALGVGCIIVGVVGLQFAQQRVQRNDRIAFDTVSEKLSNTTRRDLLYPSGAMAILGVAYVLIRYGLTNYPYPIVATAVTQTTALVVLVTYLTVRPELRRYLGIERTVETAWFSIAGVLLAIAWLAQFFALEIGTVVRIVPILNTQPMIVLLLSYALARQIPRSRQIVFAIALIVLGATLVQL